MFFLPPRVWRFFFVPNIDVGEMENIKQKLSIYFSLCFSAKCLKIYANEYILGLNNKINKLLKKLSKYNII